MWLFYEGAFTFTKLGTKIDSDNRQRQVTVNHVV